MNNRINNVKFMAAIGVVIIHLNTVFVQSLDSKVFDIFFGYISRFAVPYFLIISGYFWMGRYKKESIKSMLLLQFAFATLVAIEATIFGNIFTNYVQRSSPQWYLPAVSLMMLVALFVKKENYIYLWFGMFVIANVILVFGLKVKAGTYDLFANFLIYGYMFYFGYILKLLMNKPKFVNFISKYCYLLLGTFVAFQIFNATNSIRHFNQNTTIQFLFTIPLVLYALSPNQDRANKYNIYSLDLFLYHILIVSIISFINVNYFFLHINSITTLVVVYIIELLITVPGTIYFGIFIRNLDRKYIQLIY